MRKCSLVLLAFFGLFIASATAQEGQPNFSRFNFNVGGGMGIGRGAVGGFVGNTPFVVGGAGMNFSRMFGFSAEYMYYDLNLRPSVSQSQSLNNAGGSMNSVSLNGIVRPPYHLGRLSPYGIFGIGFYHRSVSSSTGPINPGTLCQPAWVWWDIYCVNGFTPSSSGVQHIGSFSKDAGGYNFGGGATYRLNRWNNAKLYLEFRYHKAYHSDVETEVWPITLGLRW